MRTALVVPSNRQNSIREFLNAWKAADTRWDSIIVVEDNPERTFDIDVDHHVSWKEIEADLKEDKWIISRRDSAIRSYGFLLAHRQGADYIFTLDDDCLPVNNRFVEDHLLNFTDTPRWVESIPGQRTRGLPYFNMGKSNKVALSVGLWCGVPDFDSVQVLSQVPPPRDLPGARVMPSGQYFPLCGMNFCMRREITPLCYFPLQGEGYPYRRFDDIWFGVIAKKVIDHLRLQVVVGTPYICHSKASDPMVNLVKEAPGIAANEHFWEVIDEIELTGDDPVSCMYNVANGLIPQKDEYLAKLGQAIFRWSGLFGQSKV